MGSIHKLYNLLFLPTISISRLALNREKVQKSF